MGRGPINLILNDFTEAAEYISKRAREPGRRACAAVVAPDGQLRLLWPHSDQELSDISKQNNYIGTYNQQARVEIIEDDVLFWLQSFNNHLRSST